MKKRHKVLDKVVRPDLFSGCSTPEEVKVRFRELAKTMHPDMGGTHEGFLALTKARDEVIVASAGTLAEFFAGIGD